MVQKKNEYERQMQVFNKTFKLQESPTIKAECHICFLSSDSNNSLITECNKCKNTVHADCWGEGIIVEVQDENPNWKLKCHHCKHEENGKKCFICGRTEGLMKFEISKKIMSSSTS